MDIGVAEIAAQLGISERRTRDLLASGRLPGRLVSGRWLADEAALPRSRVQSRPMSARVAWEFIWLLSGTPHYSLSQPEQSRLRGKLRELFVSPYPAGLLRSWLPNRARQLDYAIAPADILGLLDDALLVPSGISDPRAGLSAGGEAEGYVHHDDLAGLATAFLMSRAGRANVRLHVVDLRPPRPAPLGLVLADLADRDGPREDARVEVLLGERRQ
jgi:hypothetical protein